MIKTYIKYLICEYCINLIFSKITKNFKNPIISIAVGDCFRQITFKTPYQLRSNGNTAEDVKLVKIATRRLFKEDIQEYQFEHIKFGAIKQVMYGRVVSYDKYD